MTLKGDAKYNGKLTRGLKNDIRNLVNLHSRSRKTESLYFYQLLLSKAYIYLDEKVELRVMSYEKSYVSWSWRVMQSLKKNWPLFPKMTWGIWWILMRAVESLEICNLMGYFCRKYVMSELKKYTGVVSWKISYGFKNDIRNLVNFHTFSWK